MEFDDFLNWYTQGNNKINIDKAKSTDSCSSGFIECSKYPKRSTRSNIPDNEYVNELLDKSIRHPKVFENDEKQYLDIVDCHQVNNQKICSQYNVVNVNHNCNTTSNNNSQLNQTSTRLNNSQNFINDLFVNRKNQPAKNKMGFYSNINEMDNMNSLEQTSNSSNDYDCSNKRTSKYQKSTFNEIDFQSNNRFFNIGENEFSPKKLQYLEHRRKNNMAAKKSRERRRQMEQEVINKYIFLEKENERLHEIIRNLQHNESNQH